MKIKQKKKQEQNRMMTAKSLTRFLQGVVFVFVKTISNRGKKHALGMIQLMHTSGLLLELRIYNLLHWTNPCEYICVARSLL